MDRIYYQTVTVPAGTPISAPVSVPTPLEDNQLLEVEVVVPDGHCGFTGLRLLQSQQQILPWANFSWMVANDEKLKWSYTDQIQASGITALAYNTDIFQHSFYLRFTITNLPEPGAEPEAEVVAPEPAQTAFIPEADDLNTESIIASAEPETVAPEIEPITTPVSVTPFLTASR